MLEQRLEEALRALGTHEIGHSQRTFFAHLMGTYQLLRGWMNDEEVCLAGLFHSIYGTEIFTVEVAALSSREKIRSLIGARAERLAYYFCAADRRALLHPDNQRPPHQLQDRFLQQRYEITARDYRDLCEIAVANLIEQAPPMATIPEEKRRAAMERYSACLEACSPGAVDAYRSLFGLTPVLSLSQAVSADDFMQARMLFEEYAAQLGVDLCFQGFARELETLSSMYAPPRGRLLLAKQGEALVGCGALRPLEGDICEMKRLYVRDGFRGLRAGRRLATALLQEAREIGYQKMRLDTLPSMKEARALYQSLGFYEIHSYRENPIEGTLYLERALR